MFFDQHGFAIRCEWGNAGVTQLLLESDAIVIVDVLSFSTCVDIAVSNEAKVYPYRFQDESAVAYAQSVDAILANHQREFATGFSLAPSSLVNIPKGSRLVLPSPNGATLSLATQQIPTFAGCLRNAKSVAQAIQNWGPRLSIIPANVGPMEVYVWHLRTSLEPELLSTI